MLIIQALAFVLMRYGNRLRAWQSGGWEIRDGSLNQLCPFLWPLALECSTCRSATPRASDRNRPVAGAVDGKDLASCPVLVRVGNVLIWGKYSEVA
jgi:hypothetical protein